jgi:polyisoprenoid-binding protein YceI
MIRKTLAIVAILALCLNTVPAAAATTTYAIDNNHSSVSFKVRHLVGKVVGRFDDFSGTIVADRDDLTKSTVDFTINSASIDTDNENRDNHLKTADFFDVEKFPTIMFKSNKIEKSGEGTFTVTGDFTMHGVTKSITVPVTLLGFADGGGGMAGFETSFTLNRKEYGILWNKALDAGGLVLGDDVDVNITIESRVPKEE